VVAGTGITLTASAYKVKSLKKVDLAWSGATSELVDIYRNGTRVAASTANDGAHTDTITQKGGGSFAYTVCEAGSATCSEPATATF